ncbi:MAG: NAD(P)-dependent oxidoreductase [Treponema sp.]|nr:3-phosphoglycerate dehydrogenase [Spirochaetia bacterium]MDD7458670.1 NAD(P)-dependent oxidoreductase [Spirochaetales bacterium]MDY5811722.1 NAD(P)-dependent oxidoreductase [Treponema sp.]
MYKVYLNDTIAESAVKRLKQKVELVNNFDHPEELDAIIVRQQCCPKEVIEKAVKCRLIQMHGVGLERIDLKAAERCGIPVKNCPGGNSESVAELVLAMALALSRKLKFIDKGLQKGQFGQFGLPETVGSEITGKTIGLVGSGTIARLVAKKFKNGFDCKIKCYNDYLSPKEAQDLGFEKVETLEQLVAQGDIVSVHAPLTAQTENMFHRGIFDKANPDLIFINTARGGIVDEDALYNALVQKKIKAAAMDVFKMQPPDPKNPLLALDNFKHVRQKKNFFSGFIVA